MESWKKVVKAVTLGAAILALGACGNPKAKSGGSEKAEDGTSKISFWTFEKLHVEYFEDAAKTWNEKNPDKKVEIDATVIPFDQLYQKLTLALQSGNGAPDMADVELNQAATQLKGDEPAYLPLNNELEPYQTDIVQSRLDNYKKGDKYYGLDYHVGAVVTYYNTELLEQAGVDYKTIKTWDDYTEAGKKVKEKTGKWMTEVETNSSFVFDSLVAQQKADYIKDGKADLENPAAVKALTMLQNWVKKDKIARDAVGGNLDNEEFFPEMNKGNVASITMPAWEMSRFVNYMPDLKGKIAIAPMPVFEEGNNRSAAGGGTGTMVTKDAKNPETVKEFLCFAKGDKEQAIKQWTLLGFDPINTDTWSMPEMKEDNKYTEYLGKDIFDTLLEIKDEIQGVTKTDAINPKLNEELLTKVIPNTMTDDENPEKALKDADAAINK